MRIGIWDALGSNPLIGAILVCSYSEHYERAWSWTVSGKSYWIGPENGDLRIVREKKWKDLIVEMPPFDKWGNTMALIGYNGSPIARLMLRQSDTGDIEARIGDEWVAVPPELKLGTCSQER